MKILDIKSGTSASFVITPKIGGNVATSEDLSGVSIYLFLVYQFTNKVYKTPYILTAENLTINLTAQDTIDMLGNAEENQRFKVQFAIKTKYGDIIAEDKDSNIVINITRWEAGQWLNQNTTI